MRTDLKAVAAHQPGFPNPEQIKKTLWNLESKTQVEVEATNDGVSCVIAELYKSFVERGPTITPCSPA